MSDNDTVRDGFLATVLDQLASGHPPEVKATRDRLKAQGLSDNEAAQLIALVLRHEMMRMISESRSFDDARFRSLLDALPEVP